MDQQAVIENYERRAREAGLSVAKLCEHAGLHPTTFSRWKIGRKSRRKPIGMTFSSMMAVEAALAEAESAA